VGMYPRMHILRIAASTAISLMQLILAGVDTLNGPLFHYS
jgi:hypothetical protein